MYAEWIAGRDGTTPVEDISRAVEVIHYRLRGNEGGKARKR